MKGRDSVYTCVSEQRYSQQRKDERNTQVPPQRARVTEQRLQEWHVLLPLQKEASLTHES